MSRAKSRQTGRTPTRSVRVADKFWREWEMAAKLAGVDRNRFIVAVVNNAAHQILRDSRSGQTEPQDE